MTLQRQALVTLVLGILATIAVVGVIVLGVELHNLETSRGQRHRMTEQRISALESAVREAK